MAELVIADGGDVSELWSGYLQAVFAVTERLSLVERYEHFAAPRSGPSVDLPSLGLAARACRRRQSGVRDRRPLGAERRAGL